jgi:uncharacterized iron-regulated membrane protein
MRRSLLLITAIVIWAASGVSAFVWVGRRTLPYNAEGRFFDESTATVLHEQSVPVYAVLAVALALVGASLMAIWRRS